MTTLSMTFPRARKQYQCFGCLGTIEKHEQYVRYVQPMDGSVITTRLHRVCYTRAQELWNRYPGEEYGEGFLNDDDHLPPRSIRGLVLRYERELDKIKVNQDFPLVNKSDLRRMLDILKFVGDRDTTDLLAVALGYVRDYDTETFQAEEARGQIEADLMKLIKTIRGMQ